jgi:hypothetical protein
LKSSSTMTVGENDLRDLFCFEDVTTGGEEEEVALRERLRPVVTWELMLTDAEVEEATVWLLSGAVVVARSEDMESAGFWTAMI